MRYLPDGTDLKTELLTDEGLPVSRAQYRFIKAKWDRIIAEAHRAVAAKRLQPDSRRTR